VKVSTEFKQVVLGLLNYDSNSRTSLDELDKNPWLTNFTNVEYDKYMTEFKSKKNQLDK
jgi:hypothetical protein